MWGNVSPQVHFVYDLGGASNIIKRLSRFGLKFYIGKYPELMARQIKHLYSAKV